MRDPFYYLSDRFAKIIFIGIGVGIIIGITLSIAKWFIGLF